MTRGIVTKITKISTPRKLPAIRYIIYGILYTVYYIRYIIYGILYTVYYIRYIIYGILYTVYYIRYIIYGILYTVYYIRYIIYGMLTIRLFFLSIMLIKIFIIIHMSMISVIQLVQWVPLNIIPFNRISRLLSCKTEIQNHFCTFLYILLRFMEYG